MIPIKDYAKLHGVTSSTVRIKCLKGHFVTAEKIGRNWYIDEAERMPDMRLKTSRTGVSHSVVIDVDGVPDGYITLKSYAALHQLNYKVLQQQAIAGTLIYTVKVGNQWFIKKQ